MDPRYQEICNDPIESLQFDLEYYEPTQLDETYHELQRNGRHQKILSGIFQIKKIQIIDDNSTSALELSRNLLNMQTQSFSPLMDILKYRILINRGLQANSQQTKNIIIGLHLKSLNILKSQKEQFVALHIFERFYDDVIGDTIENNNFNLFQLETIDPIILVELLQIESRNNQQSSKRKQQFQLKLLSDVLSMRQIENNDFIQGYPLKYNSKILSESLAQDSQLTSGILIFFIKSSQTCNSFYNDITKMLIKILSIQNNKLLLQPEQIKQTLLLLNKCITRDQVQFTLYINDSLPIFDYYIKEGYNLQKPTQDGYVQINETETDAIIVTCIKNLSQFFELIRKHHSFNQIYIDTILVGMILNSNILSSLNNILKQHFETTTTVKYVLQFISCLANANPSLTVKIIDTNVPQILNEIINKKNIKELKFGMIKDILMFYANICRSEKGFKRFSGKAISFINDLLTYYLIAQEGIKQVQINKLGQIIHNFIQQNNNMEEIINKILKNILKQLQIVLMYKYHNLNINQDLSHQFQEIKIQIIDDNSTSALELSRNLLNMQTQSFSPLMDILKYRILINRGLQANSQQTKNIIIGLHLKSLNILKSQKEQFVALHIFERFYDDVIGDTIENNNFNLFQLETIDPIILVELLQIESRNNQQSSKRKQQFQLKLLSDVLSMRQIENNDFIQGYPLKYNSKILSESLAQDSQLTSGILIFFIKSSQTCNSFYNDITKMLIKILSIQNNKLLLQPEQIKQTLLLLNKCITRDQVQFTLYINDSLPIFDYYIKEGYNLQKPTQDGYVQINETETDAIIVTCIKNLSQFFELIRKHHSFNQIYIDTILVGMILNSNILSSLNNILKQHFETTTTVKYVLQFISCLANANPSLTVKIIDTNVPQILNEIINKKNIKELKFGMIKDILMFYANICRSEKGFKRFSGKAISFINDLLTYYLIAQEGIKQVQINKLGQIIHNFIQQNNNMEEIINKILKNILKQLQIVLMYKYHNLNINQDLSHQFQEIVKKKFVIFYFNTILFPEQNMIKQRNLGQDGIIEEIEQIFKIPSFYYISLSGLKFTNIIDKVIELISKWEAELDCPLEYASLQYLDEKQLLQQYSPKNRDIVSRFSQIFHYLTCINEKNIRSTPYEKKEKWLQKCCVLLEIVLGIKQDVLQRKINTQIVDILLRQFSYLLKEDQIDEKDLLRLDRLFNILASQLDNSPPITLEFLIIIKRLLACLSYHPQQSKIQAFLINSLLCNHLKVALKHHIKISSIDDQDKMLIQKLNEIFIQIFKLLYEEPLKFSKNQNILSIVVQEIQCLYQLTLDSYHEKVDAIMQFILSQIQPIINLLKTNDKFYQIKIRIAQLKQQFQQDILKFPISQERYLDEIEIRFDQIALFKYLQQTAYQQFNIKLNFEGFELENQNPHPWSILPILKFLSIQEYSTQYQDQYSIEMLKVLEVLLQQSEICDKCIKALDFTLTILIKLMNGNSEVINLLLNGIKKLFDLTIMNQTTQILCIKMLIKIFATKRLYINQFVLQMQGLESLFKVKQIFRIYMPILSKFALVIIYDKTLLRAQIEAKIKKIIFDQEYNEEIKSTNQNIKNPYNKIETYYPVCLQPASKKIQAKNQLKLQKNNPNLISLQNDKHYKEEVKYVMNLLFIESVEEQCFILKDCIRIDTLNSINQNGDQISQSNFKHTKETQILLKHLVQQIITLYFDNNGLDQSYCEPIFDVLQYIVSQFPLLLPSLLKINCSQFLQQYKQKIGYEQSELPTQISFLTLITKYILPSQNFIFYICLDNLVLFKKSNNIIVPFGNEIRRIIIKQLYNEICKSIKTFDEKLKKLNLILVYLLSIKSVAKICIKNINEPQDSFNFINAYIEGIKRLDWQQYFSYKDQIYFIITTLNMLYNVATCLLLENTQPTPTNLLKQTSRSQPIKESYIIGQMHSEEIQNQIFTLEKSFLKNKIKYQELDSSDIQFQAIEWPFFSVGNFQESNQIENKFQTSSVQQHFIKEEGQISPELEEMELEDEENQFIDENASEAEGQSLSNLEEVNILPQIMNDQNLNKFIDTIEFSGVTFPKQFKKQFQAFQNMLNEVPPQFLNQKSCEHNLQFLDLQTNYDLPFEIEFQKIDIDSSSFECYEGSDSLQQHEQYWMQKQYQDHHKVRFSEQEYLISIKQNSRQALKQLGKIDQQFLKCLYKFLYIDNFGEILDSINDLIKNLTAKLNISDLVIDDLISLLKLTTQDALQESIISSNNEPVLECHYSSELVRKKVLKLMLDLQELQQCNLQAKSVSELIYFTKLFKGEQQNMVIQFIFNQQQLSRIIFSKYQIQSLLNNLQKEQDEDISIEFIKCISQLWVDQNNRKKIIKLMKKEVKQIVLQNQNQVNDIQIDQIFINSKGIENIFQILEAAPIFDKEVQKECEQFLNSQQIKDLMKIYENTISIIPKQKAQQYSPALETIFTQLVISDKILNSENHKNSHFLTQLASMEFSRCNSDSVDQSFQSLSKEICEKGNYFINMIIKHKLEYVRQYNLGFSSPFVDYFQNNHFSIIDFDNKQSYFYLKMNNEEVPGKILEVRREQIFDDSYKEIRFMHPRFFGNLILSFLGEEGQDQGGLSQEWILLLTKEIVNEKNKLFKLTSNKCFYQVNRESNIDPDHLQKFYFIGQIFAIAISNKLKIFGNFPISFFKHIVGQKLSIFDIQYYDEEIYTNLNLIYNDNFSSNWGIYYSYTILNQGLPDDKELIPGGKDIEVTQQNKKDFLRKYCHEIMAKNIENQMQYFLKGFYSVIPKQQISIFDSTQLEQLLCGQSYIDVEDLILNFEYNGYTPTDQVILWLQNVLRNFSQDLLAKFLKFITAFPLMPLEGFKNSEFKILIVSPNYQQIDFDQFLPVGHTCSYELDLPPYSKQEILAQKLQLAITEGTESFSLL
ncbi:unnamed protein product [Paramecium octaurelia]|uniref:HECT domain-containing protein n=1 Tax=Paramecium octaurelia TaxID=43137 RepID=A0A8S1SVW3_PAROT|nr:unnamed protein product [Paramecium octaurelia]